jgi:regulator of sirC expression with transglutaminase-like and TPR domain
LIAETIRAHFPSQGELSPDEKFEIMDQVFFQEMQFTGNTNDYYEYQNSLLHSALQRKTAIPMTLAIIYKCVGRRLCLHIDIIGLPGHVVAHVPALDRYVDVFHGGRVLTRPDCAHIASLHGFRMVDVRLTPLSCDLVVHRILNNLVTSMQQNTRLEVTSRTASTLLIYAWNLLNNRGTRENIGSSWAIPMICDDFASDHLAGVDIASW